MTREFIRTSFFDRNWGKMKLTDEDLRLLEIFILNNPDKGDIMQGTGGAIKLRWALPDNNKGKRGGIRVIYVDLKHKEHIHLLFCFPKGKQDDLTAQ